MTTTDQADLLRRARRRASASSSSSSRPAAAGLTGPAPLSHAQQRMWLMDHLGQGGALYNVPLATRLCGPLDPAALATALTALTERHAVLRTHYRRRGDEPYQEAAPVTPVPLPVVDATEPDAPALLAAEASRPFDLATGPVLRALLLRHTPDDHTFLLTIHHIAVDGGSLSILAADLAALYEAARTGRPAHLPPAGLPYADHARRERARDAELTAAADARAAHLAGARPLSLLRPVPPGARERRAALHSAPLTPGILDDLRRLGARHGATLFAVVLAAAFATLRIASGETDLTLGCASGHRAGPDLRRTVGLGVNTLAVRADVAGDPAFTEVLARVKAALLDAQEHHDVPFDLVLERLGAAARTADGSSLLAVSCDVVHPAEPLTLPGLHAETVELDLGLAKFGLALLVEDGPRPRYLVQHDRDALDERTAGRLLTAFAELLAAIAADEHRRLDALPGERLTAAEHPCVAALLTDPRVAEATAVRPSDGPLLAYAVVRGPVAPSGGELRAGLRGTVQPAELPAAVVLLDRMPCHPDGTPDRSRLPGTARQAGAGPGPLAAVRTAFGELLGGTPPADGDFFHLGGHSLIAVQLAERLRTRTGLPLTGLDVLEQRTPHALAALLATRADERRAARSRTGAPVARSRAGTVLVTGATGGVGAAVLQELMAQGRPVRALVRPESAHLPALNGAEVAEGDLADPDSLRRAVEGADAVIHAACTFTDHATDVAAMRTLVDGWRGGPFVFVSSIDAYGRPAGTDVAEGAPSGELVSPYGRAKLDCERMLLDAARGPASIVRAPIVWGPHRRLRDQLRWGSTGALYQAALAGRPITLPDGPGWTGVSWVHSAALARALAACATENPPAAGRVVNAVTGHVSWADFTTELVRLLGSTSTIDLGLEADPELQRPWHYRAETLAAALRPEPGEDWRGVLAAMVG
ncbi:NAD-dependent epimerase/dehydratase family protein [Streptomyces kaniharaensis]|uniref:NAD-dependent epimerase/dehydratase family protein n=1 Tax=Streptomyces kaniharaensis TaxID=212423 RepID=A0A6N7L6M8_9ACTN|nr:condensation domain-containing protein [Streptomyces kaniharaensis]MQS17843.1 NAD-dependent epimerase/dehydratase family protein [Streptomyces kaniharaensis]